MKILVLNAGSSSLKCRYFEAGKTIVHAEIERIGEAESEARFHYRHHTITRQALIANHHDALMLLVTLFAHSDTLKDFTQLDAVGHRVVHGGEAFQAPVRITPEVVNTIETLIPLAPLHNPANLEAIRAFASAYPAIPQVAVFDTAFHQSMPPHAYHYAIPLSLKERYHIRRYGFHGTSHSYVAKEAAAFLKKPLSDLNLITLHLGNGASAAAIAHGKSIDTSMGMTPLEGLVMGTRSGDIDAGILTFLAREGYSTDAIDTLLNKESGLKGICGENDMRTVLEKAENGDTQAALALDLFCYRIVKYVGAYGAVLGSIDAVVFTGGIGEHAAPVREKICNTLEAFTGIQIDREKNAKTSHAARAIHTSSSRAALLVIPTDEELEIARQTEILIKQGYYSPNE
jgi:acetate kinase